MCVIDIGINITVSTMLKPIVKIFSIDVIIITFFFSYYYYIIFSKKTLFVSFALI